MPPADFLFSVMNIFHLKLPAIASSREPCGGNVHDIEHGTSTVEVNGMGGGHGSCSILLNNYSLTGKPLFLLQHGQNIDKMMFSLLNCSTVYIGPIRRTLSDVHPCSKSDVTAAHGVL